MKVDGWGTCHRDFPALAGMLELPMTAPDSYLHPSVCLNQLDNLTDLHRNSLGVYLQELRGLSHCFAPALSGSRALRRPCPPQRPERDPHRPARAAASGPRSPATSSAPGVPSAAAFPPGSR